MTVIISGTYTISKGQTASVSAFTNSASFTVLEGGVASNSLLYGATEYVYGTDLGTQINGGQQYVFAGAVASSTYDFGTQVLAGGTASSATVIGLQKVSSGGIASNTHITENASTFGVQEVYSGGVAIDTTIDGYGFQDVFSGGVASNTLLIDSAGQRVTDHGVVSHTTLEDISQLYVLSHGSAVGTLVGSGAEEVVGLDGHAEGAVISGGTLYLYGSDVYSGSIVFEGTGGTLFLEGTSISANTISGFSAGDQIEISDLVYASNGTAQLTSGNELQITEGGSTYTIDFDPGQSFAGEYFHLSAVGSSTLVTLDTTPCYCLGTFIETDAGDIAVETLAIGNLVRTMSGELRPIKWIGRRSYAGRFIAMNRDILPVCFRAGSLAEGLPRRDLWISPHHAMYFDGVLIEAKDLINGVSIVQARSVGELSYFHIELASHDVIFAEGALSESYLDEGNRSLFQNAYEFSDQKPSERRYCAPRLDARPIVEDIRKRLEPALRLACLSA